MTSELAHAWPAITAAFLGSLVEAVEALTIVLAVATVRGWRPAGLGALSGLALLVLVTLILGPLLELVPLHLPLPNVPETMLKFSVGVILSAFGVFWTGEGLGIDWPGQDLAIIAFAVLFLAAGLAAAVMARGSRAQALP